MAKKNNSVDEIELPTNDYTAPFRNNDSGELFGNDTDAEGSFELGATQRERGEVQKEKQNLNQYKKGFDDEVFKFDQVIDIPLDKKYEKDILLVK